MTTEPLIGVIGGSGLYGLFEEGSGESRVIDTPYGATSSEVRIGEFAGRRVAFLPRHGKRHSVAPHLINYRANVWALASLGVRAIVTSSAVGSISPDIAPGTFVLPDQFIDRTWGRADTFYDAGSVNHVVMAEPYCPTLRAAAAASLRELGEDFTEHGTTVVIQGPRFSTRAESRWYRAGGGDIVNMTQYPEVALAGELNLGMVNVSFITDTDADDGTSGHEGENAVNADMVLERMAAAQPRILATIAAVVGAVPADYAPRELVPAEAVAGVLPESS